jgi:hypothetical protein
VICGDFSKGLRAAIALKARQDISRLEGWVNKDSFAHINKETKREDDTKL